MKQPDLEARKREISILVDEINEIEKRFVLPEIDGVYDYDRLDAMDILNRIERKMLSKMP